MPPRSRPSTFKLSLSSALRPRWPQLSAENTKLVMRTLEVELAPLYSRAPRSRSRSRARKRSRSQSSSNIAEEAVLSVASSSSSFSSSSSSSLSSSAPSASALESSEPSCTSSSTVPSTTVPSTTVPSSSSSPRPPPVYLGLNAVTRALEQRRVSAVLVVRDAAPPSMLRHLIPLCFLTSATLCPLSLPVSSSSSSSCSSSSAAAVNPSIRLARIFGLRRLLVIGISKDTPELHSFCRFLAKITPPLDLPWLEATRDQFSASPSPSPLSASSLTSTLDESTNPENTTQTIISSTADSSSSSFSPSASASAASAVSVSTTTTTTSATIDSPTRSIAKKTNKKPGVSVRRVTRSRYLPLQLLKQTPTRQPEQQPAKQSQLSKQLKQTKQQAK